MTVPRKNDAEKPRFDLVPVGALEEIVRALTFGAKKYGDWNWRKLPGLKRRYFAAFMRHAWAWKRGEKNDPESGLHHLAHAGACVLFMLDVDRSRR